MKLSNTFERALPLLVLLGAALRTSSANPAEGNGGDVQFPPQQVPDQAQGDPGDRYIVQYANEEGRSAVRSAADRVHRELGRQNAVAAEIKNPQALEALGKNKDILSIEVDPVRHLVGRGGIRRLAESVPYGITMVQADLLAHNVVGRKKVCIIDSGYDLGHEDLPATGVTGGPDEAAGSWQDDGCKHGTHVAGTVAAVGNNGLGVRGVVENDLELHIVKVFANNCRWSYASDLIGALDACVANGASVVSMSLGGSFSSSAESQAFLDAYNNGIMSVAAASNDGSTAYSYPASYDSVVSVAAVDSTGTVASFSNQNDQVELAAPGVAVLSTLPGNLYGEYSGTSMATPHVSGAAALVWSHHPTCTAQEVRNALAVTAQDKGADGRDIAYGYGIVQASDAYGYLVQNPCGGGGGGGDVPITTTAPTPAPPVCLPSGATCSTHADCCSDFCRNRWKDCR